MPKSFFLVFLPVTENLAMAEVGVDLELWPPVLEKSEARS